MQPLLSWGKYPNHPQLHDSVFWQRDISSQFSIQHDRGIQTTLPYGCGRSYGDSCLASSGHVISMRGMDKVISVNWETGVILAEAGLTLAQLITIVLPRGWFLPVTPGTKYVTLGGAVANDVHGKNHHVNGTFGRHVNRLVIYRSVEGMMECSSTQQPDLFAATVSGLGLTGIIVAVELQLRRVGSSNISQTSIRFDKLEEFFELSQEHDSHNEYAVAWVDCLATGVKTGRGHYITGNHTAIGPHKVAQTSGLSIPIDPPCSLVNLLSTRLFNYFYYHGQRDKHISNIVEYDSFFYPLDRVQKMNRIYGKKGFQQYQCVIPEQYGRDVIREVLVQISKSRTGSFLAVMKQCGKLESPGLMSFPKHGVSLALDFPQHDELNSSLFSKLDSLIHEAGGRLYPAKDAHMSAVHFKEAYPEWIKVEQMRDPKLLSLFWQRVAL